MTCAQFHRVETVGGLRTATSGEEWCDGKKMPLHRLPTNGGGSWQWSSKWPQGGREPWR